MHHLAPPQEGPLDVIPATERSGGRVSNVLVRLEQADRPVALALAVFATGNASPHSFDYVSFPEVPAPVTLEPVASRADGLPDVIQNYEYRFAFGHPAFHPRPGTRGRNLDQNRGSKAP